MGILQRYSKTFLTLFASIFVVTLAACDGGGGLDDDPAVSESLAVTSTAPSNGGSNVGTNTKIVAVFNRAMASETISQSSFTLQGATGPQVTGEVAYNEATQTATFSPDSLSDNIIYTATITTAVEDNSGTALSSNFEWTFTTSALTDTSVPTVYSISPADTAEDVNLNTKVRVIFNEAIDPDTMTSENFRLTKEVGGNVVQGTLKYIIPTTIEFTPSTNLDVNTDYLLTLNSNLADLAGNNLVQKITGFMTGTDVSSSPAAVDLGTAGNYVILAKTGISTTGTTHITGDIAVSPESQTAMTGFSETLSSDGTFATSSFVTGEMFSADMTSPTPGDLTTAVSNMETAYTDAAGRVTPDFTELGAGEIGGLTLDPGLYKWGTGVLVTSDVTLNGSATDVWIFQIGQDLKLEDGKAVILTGGALPENVFWQVAGEVTLQAGTTFNGVVLSQTGIILKSGAVFNGRALAQTAVTLISNDVNEPAQ